MLRSVYSTSMSQHQISLLEHALREVSNVEPSGWDAIPPNLQPSFEAHMGRDAWSGLPDLMTLREAALTIIRNAITRTDEFADDEGLS
jgi:hypothetical protein